MDRPRDKTTGIAAAAGRDSPGSALLARRVAAGVALVLLVVGAVYAAQRWLSDGEQPELRAVAVVGGDVERTVTALGSLKPKDSVDVGTQVSGQLKKVHVAIGDRVENGQLIAEIDPTVYETRVRSGRAGLDNLKAQLGQHEAELALSRQQLARNRRLLAANAISRDTVEQAEAAAKVNEARLRAIRAQIVAAEASLAGDVANLGYTRIHAPVAGTVVAQSALEGQTVNASQSAPVIVRVANLDTMTVWTQVAEADVVKVEEGMPAYFTTLGMPDRRWHGTVRQVLPTPEIVNDVVLYSVLIDVDNGDRLLMSSMTVQVFFVLGRATDVPVVPIEALQRTRDGKGDTWRATVLTDAGTESRLVRIGLANRTTAEVVSGLAVGEKVVLAQQGEQAGGRAGAGRGQGGTSPSGRQASGRGGPGMGARL